MRLVKQYYCECALASVCMVLGLDYDTVSDSFQSEHGDRFGYCAVRGQKKTHRFLERILKKPAPWYCIKVLPPTGTTVDLSGKGILTIRFVLDGVNQQRHCVAYEEGMIYDPDEEEPMPLSDWIEYKEKKIGKEAKIDHIEPFN